MMVFMLVVYFGGFIYFALKKEPEKPGSKRSLRPPSGPNVTP